MFTLFGIKHSDRNVSLQFVLIIVWPDL